MVERERLAAYLDELLQPSRLRDHAPNGLQVEGREQIGTLVTGVTASQALLDAAVAARADAILVHHGYFWRNEPAPLTGWRKRRIATLLAHDISLFAYHLPLDVHPELGNNAGLGTCLGVAAEAFFGEQDLGCIGRLPRPSTAAEVAAGLGRALGRQPLLLGSPERPVSRIAWCTGGAQGLFAEAIAAGADLFVTGEVSEPCTHLARETGVAFIGAGHHATERFGVESLGRHLAEHFSLNHRFIDVDNPV